MNCRTCGFAIPQGTNICPRCGTSINPQDLGPYEPTYVRQAQPATDYGPGYYTPPPPPQYGNVGPYPVPPQAPYIPQGPAPKQKTNGPLIALVASLVLLLLILIGSGLFLLFKQNSGNNRVAATPTATPNPSRNPYPPNTGTLVINDPLHDNSKGYDWDELTTDAKGGGTETCRFTGGAYHITRTQSGSLVCPAKAPDLVFANLASEARMTVVQGNYAGIAFRVNRSQGTGYIFVVGVASDYLIDTFNFQAPAGKEYNILRKGTNSAIKRGQHQTNLVAVVANGSSISIYVNNQFIDSVQDSTYTQGEIGLYGYGEAPPDIMGNDIRVWKL